MSFQEHNIILFLISQVGLVLCLSPLINTVIKKIKAILQGRIGPPWLQGYYDLIKYFHKETVISQETSWLFTVTPAIVFTCVCMASLLIPSYSAESPLQWMGGLITMVALFGLARFFAVSAAMEPGSSFSGMACSREIMLSTLIEPTLLLSLFVIVCLSGSTNLFDIIHHFSAQGMVWMPPSYLLAMIALFIAGMAEMGRVPFDNPETHYELTMIHEGLLLEYSGKLLGLMFWAAWAKQLLILSLIANLLFPWQLPVLDTWESVGVAILLYLAKVFILCMIVAFIETIIAKMRLFRVKDILSASFVLAFIALVLTASGQEGR